MISGAIIQVWGVQATFGVTAIVLGVLLPLQYFFVFETAYVGARPRVITLEEKGQKWVESVEMSQFPAEREPYMRRLALWRGRITNESFWRGVVRPVPLIVYPAVLFGTIVNGTFLTALIAISLLSVNIFTSPPYNLNPAQIGLTNLPLLIVSILSAPLAGWMTDAAGKWMARRNKGVFEPEFRLTLMAVAVPLSTAAFVGFGQAVEAHASLPILLFFASLLVMAVPFATQPSLTYVIDCHPNDANQAFVTIFFMKAVFLLVATSYLNGWYAMAGPSVVFNSLAGINLAASALTIPAYMFGKRFRSMVSRSNGNSK